MSRTDRRTDGPTDEKTDLKNRPPVKTAVTLSGEAWHRLRAASALEGKTQSELVEGLVVKHLGGYFISKRVTVEATTGAGAGER
jgi:hypothetical protein